MQRLSIVAFLLVAACSKGASKNENTPSVASSASAVVIAAAPSAALANAADTARAWYVGTWKGELAVVRHASATSTKEGAPGAWDKDNGQKLAGPGTIEVAVDEQGRVSGSIRGALGDVGLRGQIDGEELRANLFTSSDDPTAIHHGAVVLAHQGDVLSGRLAAASGDSLALRQAEVSLKRAAP